MEWRDRNSILLDVDAVLQSIRRPILSYCVCARRVAMVAPLTNRELTHCDQWRSGRGKVSGNLLCARARCSGTKISSGAWN